MTWCQMKVAINFKVKKEGRNQWRELTTNTKQQPSKETYLSGIIYMIL